MIKRPIKTGLQPVVRNPLQLGTALLRFRKQSGWTQKQTAQRAGIKQSMVSQMERGTSGFRIGTFFKALAGLDLEIVVRSRKREES